MNQNPYAADLGDRDALASLAETPQQISRIVEPWTTADFDRSYAPGKWSARRILVHLAQTELALGTRVRYALAQEGYQAHSFNQDDWVPLDDHMDACTALNAYLALRQMNLAMWRNLREDQPTGPSFILSMERWMSSGWQRRWPGMTSTTCARSRGSLAPDNSKPQTSNSKPQRTLWSLELALTLTAAGPLGTPA